MHSHFSIYFHLFCARFQLILMDIFTGLVRMRFIESDENLALRGAALEEAIKDDIKLGLIPFWVRLPITVCCVDKKLPLF